VGYALAIVSKVKGTRKAYYSSKKTNLCLRFILRDPEAVSWFRTKETPKNYK